MPKFVWTLIFFMGLSTATFAVEGPTSITNKTPDATGPIAVPTPITKDQQKKLRSEFAKAWAQARNSFDHQMNVGIKEQKTTERIKQRDWRAKEKKDRRDYFETHHKGSEKREYVLKYIARKKEFDANQKKDAERLAQEWKDRRKAFEDRRKQAQKVLDDALKAGVNPDPSIWPTGQ